MFENLLRDQVLRHFKPTSMALFHWSRSSIVVQHVSYHWCFQTKKFKASPKVQSRQHIKTKRRVVSF